MPQKTSTSGKPRLYLAGLMAGQLGFIVWAGGDVLRFDRFTLPVLPPYIALAWMGVSAALTSPKPTIKKITGPAAVAALVILAGLNLARVPNALSKYCYNDWMHAAAHREIGKTLGRLLPAGSTVVTNEVGAIAYHSRLPVIDMIGLTDATISKILYESYRRFGRGGSDWSVAEVSRYLMSRRPDCLLLPAYLPLSPGFDPTDQDRMHLLWYRLYHDLENSGKYRRLGQLKIHDSKYVYIYLAAGLDPVSPWPRPGLVSPCFEIISEGEN